MSGRCGVIIGSIILRDFEIPEHVSFGGTQMVKVHRLPGGARVVDAMGPDDADISWSGIMLGPDASDRARGIDYLRRDGQPTILVFGDMAAEVIVTRFEADYRNPAWIGRYRIRCLLLPDVVSDDANPSSIISSDIAAVLSFDPDQITDGMQATLLNIQANLGGDELYNGNADASSAITQITSLQGSLDEIADSAEDLLESAAIRSTSSAGDIGGTACLTTIAQNTQSLAKTAVISALLTRSNLVFQQGTTP